jgi:sn-glycerol 3-phosphate transport system ATP-binding protein
MTIANFSGRGQLLGIRPEDISIGPSGVPAIVEHTEFLGADTLVRCRAGTEALVVRAPGPTGHAQGSVVNLRWELSAQHFFDAASGDRTDPAAAARAVA